MLRRALPLFLLVAALSAQQAPPAAPSVAKPAAKAPAKLDKATEKELARWLERARYWTDAALEDDWRLNEGQRALVHARLAEMWWKTDPKRARAWLDASLQHVNHPSQNESEEQARQRLEAAKWMSGFAGKMEPNAKDAIMASVLAAVQRLGRKDKDAQQAVLWMQAAALNSIDDDPKASADTLRKLLPYASEMLQEGLLALYGRSPELGADLQRHALQQAQSTGDQAMVFELIETSFPRDPDPQLPKIPADLQQATLALATQMFLHADATGQDPADACTLASEFPRLIALVPSQQAAAVQAAVSRCQQAAPSKWTRHDIAQQQQQLTTPDDYLRAAAAEPDPALRAQLKAQAAFRLRKDDPDRALTIVEGMTEEEKEAYSIVPLRDGILHDSIRTFLKAKDYGGVQRMIDRCGHDARVELLAWAAMQSRSVDAGFARALYVEARRELPDAQTRNPLALMQVLGLAAVFVPGEMADVQREVYSALNHMPAEPPSQKAGGIHYPALWQSFGPTGHPREILDLDDGTLRAAVSTLESPPLRVAVALSLARASITRRDVVLADAGLAPKTENPHQQ